MRTTSEAKAMEKGRLVERAKTVEVQGNWMEQKEKLKTKFGLTYAELSFKKGEKDEMLARLQIKLGKSKDELLAIIAAL
ncbi:MAG TPA: hypothetical protein VE978_12595 [Chitinophagales bacterium]|nr:hypothetical protein [Chitinophagales bacterium]